MCIRDRSTSLTPVKGQSLADGVWYWRVAFVDANNKVGPYSPVQSFTKEYPTPTLSWPEQDQIIDAAPTFAWEPIDGAAYYKLDYANNSSYNGATSITTDQASTTPTKAMAHTNYFWRVQMFDADRNPGALVEGKFLLGYLNYLPTVEGP